jgi:two-component system chemotaxis sensor kinase CheA
LLEDDSYKTMLEMFIYETSQNIEQLELSILAAENAQAYTSETINEIFRIMHTIKGSAAIMSYNNIATLAHAIEDLFNFLRGPPQKLETTILSDLIFEGIDFIRVELHKLKNGEELDGNATALVQKIKEYLFSLNNKPESQQSDLRGNYNYFRADVFFTEGCEMENIRAYALVFNLQEFATELHYYPSDIEKDDKSAEIIKREGFKLFIKTSLTREELVKELNRTIFLEKLELEKMTSEEWGQFISQTDENGEKSYLSPEADKSLTENQFSDVESVISVNVAKLDRLMDLVGELVIAEALVTQNPDLAGLELGNFHKAANQLHKITTEIQDTVMSVRMMPLAFTFHKMHRLVRDMSKKLGKEVRLKLIGEETEVDKNIIEHIGDPLMHLVRNSIDHGIETVEERVLAGKPPQGTVVLEAKNFGSDVLISIKDDGRGLSKEKILRRAQEHGLLSKPADEMTEKEIYDLIFTPGFSTKNNVSEYSGRGVGMDVVAKNIEAVGGSVSIESVEGVGSTVTLKIPLTLAIIDGMNVRVGSNRYTIPTTFIKESFRPKSHDLINDLDGNEMVMVRGNCYRILRLHKLYHVNTAVTDLIQGILIIVEQDNKSCCIFADELLGQQQVVVKALPTYIRNLRKIRGLAVM